MRISFYLLRALAETKRLAIVLAPLNCKDPRYVSNKLLRIERNFIKDCCKLGSFTDPINVYPNKNSLYRKDGAVWMCLGKGVKALSQIPQNADMVFGDDGYTWLKVFEKGEDKRVKYSKLPKLGVISYVGVEGDKDTIVKIHPTPYPFIEKRDGPNLTGVFHWFPGIKTNERLYAIVESKSFVGASPKFDIHIKDGIIDKVDVIDPGSGFSKVKEYIFGNGNGAKFKINVVGGAVKTVDVIDGGSGYDWCDLVVGSEKCKVFPAAPSDIDELISSKTSLEYFFQSAPASIWLVACENPMINTINENISEFTVIKRIGQTTSPNTEIDVEVEMEI